MQLNLKKPICFFDLETTGINITTDRIVEIAILKVFPSGEEQSKRWRVNPSIPIPKETAEIHGISDADVVDKPFFEAIAHDVSQLLEDADLGGFNSNRFDIPLLAEELLRAGVPFSMENRQAIDVQTIFHKMEARTLSAAYQFYCKKNLDNAHSADADTQATYDILKAQLEHYDDLENEVSFLADFSRRKKTADLAGFVVYDDTDSPCFSFGKYKGKRLAEVFKKDPGYFGWISRADFPRYTKEVIKSIKTQINQNS